MAKAKVQGTMVFINNDITSEGPVQIRPRGKWLFIESDKGCIRAGIGTNGKIYLNPCEKRENQASAKAVQL